MATTTTRTIEWSGRSGRSYTYYIYPIGTPLKKVPGNYVFARETKPRRWTPIYVGETGDLSERFDNHHKMTCIKAKGATHIHAHASSAVAQERRSEERDIIGKWSPPCND